MPGAPRKYKVQISNHEDREKRFLVFSDALKWAKRECAVMTRERVTITDTKSKIVLWDNLNLTETL